MLATWTVTRGATRWALCVVAAVAMLACALVGRAVAQAKTRSRADVLDALASASQTLAQNPQNVEARQQLARLQYEAGDFWAARETLRPALERQPSAAAVLLAAELEYLLGHYEDAEPLYREVLARPRLDASDRTRATVGLGFVYYQTNRFDRFAELEFARGVQFPGAKLIREFGDRPYRLTWREDRRRTEVPFVVTDPLPVLAIQYDGHPVHVLFDTGADMCIVDSELARQWGVQEVSWTVGGFGGGKLGRLGYGRLRSVSLGDVTLEHVPVWILPTQRFSSAFAGGKHPIGGIIGTGLARQFLATLDYEQAKFVLRERSPQAAQALRDELAGRLAAEVPFVLSSTHWMMARGALNGREGLTFFVDSGLASDAAFSAPPQTLRYVGIPLPEKKLDPKSAGGGGGAWASGQFPIASLALGSLRQENLKGEFGSRPESSYWQSGFIQDGLISHAFLRQYASWTIDFDAMTYLFAKPASR
jgi:hypothetical protein